MTKSPRQGSRADAVTASLRADILAGRLEPGRRLTFPELCSTYSVSVGVLRESLVRLTDHGIVRAESNLGFSVMSLSDGDLVGLSTTRSLIEPGFVRDAVDAGSMQWEAQLVAAHHLLERTPMSGDRGVNEAWVTAHAEFHLAIVAGASNRRMIEITRRLREEADLYRRWYLDPNAIDEHSELAAHEHRELLTAALARDAVVAEHSMRQQIERATELWLAGRPVKQPA
jgi:DNA-binding GntR family transcriptional regulator